MKRWIVLMIMGLVLTACSDKEERTVSGLKQEVVTVNVDVILPTAQRTYWQKATNEVLAAIDDAQQSCTKRVKLNLRYHDEDAVDLEKLAYALANPGKGEAPYVQPDTCHAIIGPYHSYNARHILNYASRSRLPVVMPTCTSAELQRNEARQTNSFFLTESDLTQCEVLLTVMKTLGHQRVALLYSDDDYGQSFRDWFGFLATQANLDVVGINELQMDVASLEAYFDRLSDPTPNPSPSRGGEKSVGEGGMPVGLILALSRTEQYKEVLEVADKYKNMSLQGKTGPTVYVTDTGLSDQLFRYDIYGVSPIGSAKQGFPQHYYALYGMNPPQGTEQMYDALTIIALGAAARAYAADPDVLYIDGQRVQYEIAPYGPVLSDWMRAVLATDDPAPVTSWIGYGLASAFRLIEGGAMPNLCGATGELEFDPLTYTTILHTAYEIWKTDPDENAVIPFAAVSTDSDGGSLSVKALWDWQATISEPDPEAGADAGKNLGPTRERWAMVISPSTTWANYRHQADALAMYQLLRYNGYDDDHIVLIVEDNLAYVPENPFPGEIFVERSTSVGVTLTDFLTDANVRQDAVVDYHFSDLGSPDDLGAILLGRSSDRLPHVIRPTADDNVLIFWSGHGGDIGGPLWGNEDCRQPFGIQRIKSITEQMTFRRMLMAVETCYSGQWGEALTGIPDLLVLTAANACETSKPDIYDADMKTYLSNAFSRSFLRAVAHDPDVTLHDIYYVLARTTAGSHVTLYNIDNYGSVYNNTMGDYFGIKN